MIEELVVWVLILFIVVLSTVAALRSYFLFYNAVASKF
jgi:hypothetical protein